MPEQKDETKKTVVSFIVGLLIGGTLVWAFGGAQSTAPTQVDTDITNSTTTTTDIDQNNTGKPDNTTKSTSTKTNQPTTTPIAKLSVGTGAVTVADDQSAGSVVHLAAATFPVKEGWIGVRDYTDNNLGNILGVVRFSETQNIVPTDITLQRATSPGKEYAVVIFSDNGDGEFNLANDVQVNKIFATFTAK